MRSQPTRRPRVEVELPLDGKPREVAVTPCCGARLWVSLNPTQCPLCWRPLGKATPAVERTPAKVQVVTRYWS